MLGDKMDMTTDQAERLVKSFESIARSLEKMSNELKVTSSTYNY